MATSKSFGVRPDKEVPDRAADHVGVEALAAQALHDPHGVRIQVRRVDPVLLLRVDVGFLLYGAVWRCSVSEKQSAIPALRAVPSYRVAPRMQDPRFVPCRVAPPRVDTGRFLLNNWIYLQSHEAPRAKEASCCPSKSEE